MLSLIKGIRNNIISKIKGDCITLQDIADGATPGESKKKTTETSSSEESSYDGYDDYDYNQEENYGY